MGNDSSKAFRAALRAKVSAAKVEASTRIEQEAQDLARAMRIAASAHARSGNTVASIQVEKVSARRFRVTAGGDLTTKEVRKGTGVPYDYVRAEEFGTVKGVATPFFFTTYRQRKAGIKRRVTDGIEVAIL